MLLILLSESWFTRVKTTKDRMGFAIAGLGTNWLILQKYLFIIVPSGLQVFDWKLQKFITHISIPGASSINAPHSVDILAVIGTSSGQIFHLTADLQAVLLKTLKVSISAVAALKSAKTTEYAILAHEQDTKGEKEEMAKVYLMSNGKCMLQGRGRGLLDVSPEGIILFATKLKVQRWEYSSDPKATRIQTLTHTEQIYQCRSSISGNLLISDHAGKIIQFKVQDGRIDSANKIVRHWHSLPNVDFVTLEGNGLVSAGQESVLVKWSPSAGNEKGGKQFLPRLGGHVNKIQVSKYQDRLFAFLSTCEEELIVMDLVQMKVYSRLQLWGGTSSPMTVIHPTVPNTLLTDLLGGVQFYNIREQKSYRVHYPEPLDRITPNEAKDVIKYPKVYSASFNPCGNMLATVEKSIGDTQIMRIYRVDGVELAEECTVYQPHNDSPLQCAWQDDDTLISHSPALKECKVWKRGKTVLQEEMGKWRVCKLHSGISHFAAKPDHLVIYKEEGKLILNDHAIDIPQVSISGMWFINDFLIIQANNNQLLVLDILRGKIIGDFANVNFLQASKDCFLYEYNGVERYIAAGVDFRIENSAWNRTPATNVIGIMHSSEGSLVKRFRDHLEVDFDAPVVKSLELEKQIIASPESESEEEDREPKRHRKAINLQKALLSLVPSHELPPISELFELFVSS